MNAEQQAAAVAEAAAAVQRAEQIRQQTEAELRRHGQAMVGLKPHG
ncbi:hypothetical protein [Streptomyces sp. H27-S2]|nr:hypothetical protein [Streptomyces sp. H27-S2]MCY0954137.1 hypothetical protein [Streptomyces sp. H27-S2]